MLTAQNIVVAVALLLLVWYFAGAYSNRQRAAVLIRDLREALSGAGTNLTIAWHGRSAFQITVGQPFSPLTGLQALCLLEPREFALALAWNRLKGRRDQVLLGAACAEPLPAVASLPPAAYGIPGLSALEVYAEAPHLRLTLQVGVGNEGAIGQAVALVQQMPTKKQKATR